MNGSGDAHGAGIELLSPQGVLAKYFYGSNSRRAISGSD
jgi:hypothetical protein